jgi:hypothetical protein
MIRRDEDVKLNYILSISNGANYSSSFDAIVTTSSYEPPPGDSGAWQKQETHKGRGALDPAGTSWAGWGFEHPTYETNINGVVYTFDRYPDAAAANAAPAAQLRDIPVFIHRPQAMFASVVSTNNLNEILAAGIPALSPSTGKTEISTLEDNNFNMNLAFRPEGGAWGRNHEDYEVRWLHSDMKDMALFYTHKLFDKLVEEGSLE